MCLSYMGIGRKTNNEEIQKEKENWTTEKKMRYLPLLFVSVIIGQDEIEELDLDAMWENTVWEEIQDVTSVEYEVEKVTAVAGVRGAEAEDEALALLYYRKSMKGLSELDLQKALGKLILKKEQLEKQKKETKKIDKYISQLKYRLSKV